MLYSDLMKKRRKELSLSKSALSRMVDISDVHLHLVEQGKRGVSFEVIGRIETALGFENNELVNSWLEVKRPGTSVAVSKDHKDLRSHLSTFILDADQVEAIKSSLLGQKHPTPSISLADKDPVIFSQPTLLFPWGLSVYRLAIRIKDDDMAPEIKYGDVVIVDTKRDYSSGDFVLVWFDDRVSARQYVHSHGPRIMRTFNPQAMPTHLKATDTETVIGLITTVVRDFVGDV